MRFRARQKRYPVNFPATAVLADARYPCTVVNIHENGMQLTNIGPLQRGQTVRMDITAGQALGTVRWARGNRAGIMLLKCLSPQMREKLYGTAVPSILADAGPMPLRPTG